MGLDKLREEIWEINDDILKLLAKRNDVAKKIGEYKKENGVEIFHPGREEEILKHVSQKAQKLGLDEDYIRELFVVIMKNSKNIQSKCK